MKTQFGQPPDDIRAVQHFLKLAEDHDERNVVVAYYSRMSAIQLAMKIMPGPKPPEVSRFLVGIMEWLERAKQEHQGTDGIANETVAQAIIEEYMLRLYNFAYQQDCDRQFNKNMVKSYYTANLLCDVLAQFGVLSEDLQLKLQTSKFRATYIHNMMKQGLEPTPVNVCIVESEAEEREHVLSLDELNARRIARGEEPLPPEPRVPRANYPTVEDAIPDDGTDDLETDEPLFRNAVRAVPPPPPPDYVPEDVGEIIRAPVRGGAGGSSGGAVADLSPEQNDKAMKYCKFASSALNYDDVKTAIFNLEKALHLCKYGVEME